MSLHVRLFTNFWTHRKTARLRALIGNDAYWVPLRIWSYAAENQPDGDFSKYSPEELALLINYNNNAQALLQALQQALFMDGMKIHDWEEHNGYHHSFSERAKNAANARWKGKDKKGKDKKGDKHCLEHDTSINESKNLYSYEFLQTWMMYPNKTGKLNAYKSWKSLKPNEELKNLILKAIEIQKTWPQWNKEDGKYIPHFSTWMNQMRWEDEGISSVKTKDQIESAKIVMKDFDPDNQ